jgi:hypothetical protein
MLGLGVKICRGIKKVSAPALKGFITEWTVAGDADARTITLPLVDTRTEGALAYNCIVDWGDGTANSAVTTYNDTNRIHTYATNGTYQVEITGTMEGWSFNNTGDKLKITKVVNWGDVSKFNGFKYLKAGFYGCTNLTSLGVGIILASGTGVLSQGFYYTFYGCASLTTIPTDLFKYNTAISASGFCATFRGCTSLTTIPTDLFKYNTAISTSGFYATFQGCTSLTTIPTDLFKYNIAVSTSGFYYTFYGCASLTTIPTDLFKYNTAVSTYGFYHTFYGCASLTTIPTDLFKYNTAVSTSGFYGTFRDCTSLTTIPTDLFKYNTAVSTSGFCATFYGCTSLTTVPTDLFRYNTACLSFTSAFQGCVKLQLNTTIFYGAGESGTRFLNQSVDFTSCFSRSTFSGTQGTAPDVWNCNFGTGTPTKTTCFGGAGNSLASLNNYNSIPSKLMTINVSPAVDWAAGDIITGQTSGKICTIIAKISTTTYWTTTPSGTYTAGEVIGVTGNADKLADQDAGAPTFSALWV